MSNEPYKVGDIVTWRGKHGRVYQPGPYYRVAVVHGNYESVAYKLQHLDGSPLYFSRGDGNYNVPHEYVYSHQIQAEPFIQAVNKALECEPSE